MIAEAHLAVLFEVFLHEDDVFVLYAHQDVDLLEDVFPRVLVVAGHLAHLRDRHDFDGKLLPGLLVRAELHDGKPCTKSKGTSFTGIPMRGAKGEHVVNRAQRYRCEHKWQLTACSQRFPDLVDVSDLSIRSQLPPAKEQHPFVSTAPNARSYRQLLTISCPHPRQSCAIQHDAADSRFTVRKISIAPSCRDIGQSISCNKRY